MLILNGTVFLEDGLFRHRDIRIENGRVAEIGENLSRVTTDELVIDAGGMYVLPGLCDIHSHGAMGHDFSDANPAGLRAILAYEKSVGVTAYCPTSMTVPKEKLLSAFAIGRMVAEEEDAIVGFHMEGPFINPQKKGAQKAENILAADAAFFEKCNHASGGRIREVTLAPEMDGMMGLIEKIPALASVGHTNADYDTAFSAMQHGARHVTHLYNAMPSFSHRAPGVIGAAFDYKDTVVELIADGIHVHDSVIRSAFGMFRGRVALISDSMRATGLGDGAYTLGGQDVFVNGAEARLEDGTIAGSVTNLYDCMLHAIAAGVPCEEAILSATIVPAKSIGVDGGVGSIKPGKWADLILADYQLNRRKVIFHGKEIKHLASA